MKIKFDVLSVGDGNLDVWMRVPSHASQYADKERGTGVTGTTYYVGAGGAAANVAIGSSRLGGRAAFVGAIGDDPSGTQFKNYMRSAGVDLKHLHIMANQATSLACMFETPDGEYEFYVCPGSRNIPSHCLPDEFVKSSKVLFLTGHVLTENYVTSQTMLTAMDIAQESGVTVAFSPGKYWLNKTREPVVHEAIKRTDILLNNSLEAKLITRRDSVHDAVQQLLEEGVLLAAVTLGDRGCLVASTKEIVEQPAFPSHAKSAVGAGDAFASGFLYSYLLKWTLEEIASFANATAAIKIRTPGAVEGFPHADEVKAFMKENDK